MLVGSLDAIEQPAGLLLFRDVQKEFEYPGAVANQVIFEVADLAKTPAPNVLPRVGRGQVLMLEHLRVYPRHQDFFVVRAVEDADPPALRQHFDAAPQEIVLELLGRWLPESVHVDTLGVEPGGNVLDYAVLAGGVHALEDDQQGVGLRGP